MYSGYWDLFWTTGMPQAWLMSREREGRMDAPPSLDNTWRQGLSAPPVDFQLSMMDGIPGGPKGIV